MLQLTGVVDERAMRAQYLDRMDIERERGITIKSQAVRMPWTVPADNEHAPSPARYVLNMIDTPGHVDFTYEVSRSLEACEAAVLLVDAAQGIEAQTLANLYLALGRTCTSSRCSTRSTCRARARRSTPPSSRTSSAATRVRGAPGLRQDRLRRGGAAQRDRRARPRRRWATPTPRRGR